MVGVGIKWVLMHGLAITWALSPANPALGSVDYPWSGKPPVAQHWAAMCGAFSAGAAGML